jgi:tight adherence protein C
MALEIIVGALTLLAVMTVGGAILLLVRAKREEARAFRRVMTASDDLLAPEDERAQIIDTVHRVGELASSGRYSKSLREDLARAGYHSQSAAAIYVGTKILLFAIGLAIFAAVALTLEMRLTMALALIVFGSGVLFFIPNVIVDARRRERLKEVERRLPDSVDLLEICVSSGMGIDMAWNAVADEMELTNLEIGLGVPRTVAMRHMAERTGVDDISSFVALLIQAERFGSSIVEALATFARSMREVQSSRAEERAEKMAVRMLFPMVLFIFPSLLMVTVGPAVMNIVEVMT